MGEDNETSLRIAAEFGNAAYALQLLCFGAVIDNKALVDDETALFRPIQDG